MFGFAVAKVFLRLQPRTGVVRPYVDGLIGFHLLNSQTEFPDEFEEGIMHNQDATSSRGIAASLMIRLKSDGYGFKPHPGPKGSKAD